ncbi:MAG: MFS transporter [Anaerolineae bacterium]|nr:MFS transporter [Anaerolineae bacterium]
MRIRLTKTVSYIRWWFTERFVPWFQGPDPRNHLARNTWHLYQDLIWLGLASATSTYINVYAIRLGATDKLIGLRTAIPSLLVVLLRIPAAQLMERTHNRKKLIVRSLFAGRLFYFLIFLLPWLSMLPVLKHIPPATILVWTVICIGIPSALSQAGWDTFFADIVPPRKRARVVSTRSTMTNLITLSVVPLFGIWLDWAPFPVNYQVIFLLAFIGAMLSTWHVNQIKVPESAVSPNKKAAALNISEIKKILFENKEFAALVLGTFIYQWAISIASPLFTIYYVDYLGASDSWIGYRMTLASLVSILAYRVWPRQIELRGNRSILVLAAPMMALFPLLTGLVPMLLPHMFIVMIPRFFGAAVMIARYGILLRVCPAERRPTFIAIYAIVVNIAAFIAPLLGVELVDYIGIQGVFFVAAALRLAAGLMYLRLPKTRMQQTMSS